MSTAPLSKQYTTVNGKQMAYHDSGTGDPVVFLHGNPTSSYLWRNIVPHVSGQARCVVPDLIGHGDSDKLDEPGADSYTFVEHREYLDGLLDQLDLGDNITLVVHDWGSALGFDWANRHRDRVAGIAYMEAIVRPVVWDEWPESARSIFQAMRSGAGEEMVLDEEPVRRSDPAGVDHPQALRRGDERVPPPVRRAGRGPPSDADLAATDPDRRRTGRRRRDRPVLRRLVVDLRHTEAVHQRRAGHDPDRTPTRVRPHLAKSDRGDASPASISSRRTAPTRSARRSPPGYRASGGAEFARAVRCAFQRCCWAAAVGPLPADSDWEPSPNRLRSNDRPDGGPAADV